MQIKGWVRSSLVDYPGAIAASLFCGSCNFRCPNCHNAQIVLHPDTLPDVSEDEVLAELGRRRGFLDGVVISGGEPTLQRDLASFALRLHDMGYLVKLDTNGYRPDVLEEVLAAAAVDYVAMDVKAPLHKYSVAAGVPVIAERIGHSIHTLLQAGVSFEFRTTVVPGILDDEDIVQIAQMISGPVRYYLQQFVPHNTLDPAMERQTPYLPERLKEMAELARPWVGAVELRGI